MGEGDDVQERTDEEEAILEEMAEKRGDEFAEVNDELILAQARLIGDL